MIEADALPYHSDPDRLYYNTGKEYRKTKIITIFYILGDFLKALVNL